MTILIISPNKLWSTSAQKAFLLKGFQCDAVHTGNEGQFKAQNKRYDGFVIDLEVKNNNGIEIFNSFKEKFPESKIVLMTSSTQNINEIHKIVIGPGKLLFHPSSDTVVNEMMSLDKVSEEIISDSEFSRVNILDIHEEGIFPFSIYSRLGSDRFKQIKEIKLNEKISSKKQFIYFKQSNRLAFIAHQNEMAKQMLKKSSPNHFKIIMMMKATIDQLFQHVSIIGIQPPIAEEAKTIFQNIFHSAQGDSGIIKTINDPEKFNPSILPFCFLVPFFSVLICKNLEWVGQKTINVLALGAIFHDIGILHLPTELRELDPNLMSYEQKTLYETHPAQGAVILERTTGFNESVIQIVHQHHEYMDGSGFPDGLTGNKILPLAKVICLANGFSVFLKEQDLSPTEGIKVFVNDHNNLVLYDSILLKNFIKSLK